MDPLRSKSQEENVAIDERRRDEGVDGEGVMIASESGAAGEVVRDRRQIRPPKLWRRVVRRVVDESVAVEEEGAETAETWHRERFVMARKPDVKKSEYEQLLLNGNILGPGSWR